ncbi:hypothetical protein D3C72_1408110 [compost metagenome]
MPRHRIDRIGARPEVIRDIRQPRQSIALAKNAHVRTQQVNAARRDAQSAAQRGLDADQAGRQICDAPRHASLRQRFQRELAEQTGLVGQDQRHRRAALIDKIRRANPDGWRGAQHDAVQRRVFACGHRQVDLPAAQRLHQERAAAHVDLQPQRGRGPGDVRQQHRQDGVGHIMRCADPYRAGEIAFAQHA